MSSSGEPAVTVVVAARDGLPGDAPARVRTQRGVSVVVEPAVFGGRVSLSTARAAAAGRSRTPWLAFLDEGDAWAPDRLARTVAAAQEVGAEWAYGSAVLLHAAGGVRGVRLAEVPESLPARLRGHNVIGGFSCALVRADLLQRAGGVDRGLAIHDAWELWLRLSAIATPAAVAEPLVAEREIGPDVPRVRDPRRALAEHRRLVDSGRIDARGPAYRLWLAADLAAAGRSWRAASVLLSGAVRHRRPQDVQRAQRTLRGVAPGSATAYARPGWLASAAA